MAPSYSGIIIYLSYSVIPATVELGYSGLASSDKFPCTNSIKNINSFVYIWLYVSFLFYYIYFICSNICDNRFFGIAYLVFQIFELDTAILIGWQVCLLYTVIVHFIFTYMPPSFSFFDMTSTQNTGTLNVETNCLIYFEPLGHSFRTFLAW